MIDLGVNNINISVHMHLNARCMRVVGSAVVVPCCVLCMIAL